MCVCVCVYACIINTHVPHEVKYQRAFIAKRTSKMM